MLRAKPVKFIFFILISLLSWSQMAFAADAVLNINLNPEDYATLFKFDEKNREKSKVKISINNSESVEATVNFKGHTTILYPKRGLSVKFKKPNSLFNEKTEIVFNPMFTDKSFIREVLAWQQFKELNGFGPFDYGYFRVYINKTYLGLYIAMQPVNKELLKEKAKGLLFEAKHDVHMADLKPLREDYVIETYEKKGSGEIGYSKLYKLIESLNSVKVNDFSAKLKENVNISSVYNWFALNVLTMQGDTYVKNYYLYYSENNQPNWSIIPWDYDLSYGRDGDPSKAYPLNILNDLYSYSYPALNGPSNLIKDNLLNSPELLTEFKNHLKVFIEKQSDFDKNSKKIDAITKGIVPYLSDEPYSWSKIRDFENQTETLKFYGLQRSNFIKSQFLQTLPKATDFNQATVQINTQKKIYSFIDIGGRTIALIKFKTFKNLKSVTVKALPSYEISKFKDTNYIKRLVQVYAEPTNATFEAELVWEYLDAPGLTEVAGGVSNDYNFLPFSMFQDKIMKTTGHVNNYGNLVFQNISNKQSGPNFYYGAKEVPQPKWAIHQSESWLSLNSAISNESDILAVADDGYIYKFDADKKFSSFKLPYRSKLTSIVFDDENYFVSDYLGHLIKVSRSLNKWDYNSQNLGVEIKQVYKSNKKTLLALTKSGSLLTSSDKGVTWKNTFNINLNVFSLAQDENSIFLTAQDGIYKSEDGGLTWAIADRNSTDIKHLQMYANSSFVALHNNLNQLSVHNFATNKINKYSGPKNLKIDLIYYCPSLNTLFISGFDGEIYSTKNLLDWTLEHKSEHKINGFVFNEKLNTMFAVSRNLTIFSKKY